MVKALALGANFISGFYLALQHDYVTVCFWLHGLFDPLPGIRRPQARISRRSKSPRSGPNDPDGILAIGQHDAIFAASLHGIHGCIGRIDQLLSQQTIYRITGNADTGANMYRRLLINFDRLADKVQQFLSNLAEQAGFIPGFGDDHREFVPTQPGRQIVRSPQALVQAKTNRLQHDIASRMAMRVVDRLESIEIDQHQTKLVIFLLSPVNRLVDKVLHAATIGQTRQEIDLRRATCFGLPQAAGAYIVEHAFDHFDIAVLADADRNHAVRPTLLTIIAAKTQVVGNGLPGIARLPDHRPGFLGRTKDGVDEVATTIRRSCIKSHPDDPRHQGRVAIKQGTAGAEDHDTDVGRIENPPVVRFHLIHLGLQTTFLEDGLLDRTEQG